MPRLLSGIPRLLGGIIVIASLLGGAVAAHAGVVITVDKTAQRLSVAIDGERRYEWPVSTARIGYRTPNGTYRPERLARQWFSRKYDWSPMPYSIFFDGGYAIHGSYEISRIGRPASHGCIRLHPANAAVLFALVQRRSADTRIIVTGDGPEQQMVRWSPARRIAPTHRHVHVVATRRHVGYVADDARGTWAYR